MTRSLMAAADCHIHLATQADAGLGFAISVRTNVPGCPLSTANLDFLVGTSHVVVSEPWQMRVPYTAQAVFLPTGDQNFYLNGNWVGSNRGVFQPATGPLVGSADATAPANAEYVVRQLAMKVTNGTQKLSIEPNKGRPVPMPLIALVGGPAPWPTPFSVDLSATMTVTVIFRFDANPPDPRQFKPFFDRYGQATASSWPGKIVDATAASQLQAAASAEQTWLAENPPLTGLDPYGGSTVAGWPLKGTQYFRTVFRNNRWWLISPDGNPMFYMGVTGLGLYQTPITNREDLFTGLPSPSGLFAPAYSTPAHQSVTYYSPVVANEILKYCGGAACDYESIGEVLEQQRLASWGFSGMGKFAPTSASVSAVPVLEHDPTKVPKGIPSVPNVVPNGHPDVFDQTTLGQLQTTLDMQMGTDKTNPFIVGWGVGNEKYEIISTDEIGAMLLLGPTVPAKRHLVDYALTTIYHGSIGAMARAWGVTALNKDALYAAQPTDLPSKVIEQLREFWEGAYYSALHLTVQSLDRHHLYFGSWIVTGDPNLAIDWAIAAANCDVIGFDDFSPGPLSTDLVQLFRTTHMPVMLGAFGAPADYAGMRGFGWSQYTQALTLTDAASGDAYAQRLQSAAADPHVIGAMWFDYHDEPISGRGAGDSTDGSGALVIGEDFAFGLLDLTDTPKYDLVNKVRAANIAVLRSLGLLGGGH